MSYTGPGRRMRYDEGLCIARMLVNHTWCTIKGADEMKWMRWLWRNGRMKFVAGKTGETPRKTYPDSVSFPRNPHVSDTESGRGWEVMKSLHPRSVNGKDAGQPHLTHHHRGVWKWNEGDEPTTKPTWSDRDANSGPRRWEVSVYSLAPRNRIIIN